MNILIAYASKSGTTKKCTIELAKLLPNVTLSDLSTDTPDITSYDTVIIGGSIRMGMLHKKAKAFISSNLAQLQLKNIAFFICNGFYSEAPSMIDKNFSLELRTKALCIASFGGETELTNLKGMEKFITKIMMNSNKNSSTPPPKILYENINVFAECIRRSKAL